VQLEPSRPPAAAAGEPARASVAATALDGRDGTAAAPIAAGAQEAAPAQPVDVPEADEKPGS
jgi:hypothetical protein